MNFKLTIIAVVITTGMLRSMNRNRNHSGTGCFCWNSLFFVSIIVVIKSVNLLQNVRLVISPKIVERGQNAVLRCHYDLELEPLYSVKWYRGHHEFYRFSPNDSPATKIFPFSTIHVDLSQSNGSQVTLRKLDFSLSGNYSCEVTSDAPKFSTAIATDQMVIVVLPKKLPVLRVDKESYLTNGNDHLAANCTSASSRPSTSLAFLINNRAISATSTKKYTSIEDSALIVTFSTLRIELQSIYFINQQLILTCLARIEDFYNESVEVILADDNDADNDQNYSSGSRGQHSRSDRNNLIERGSKQVMSSSKVRAMITKTTPTTNILANSLLLIILAISFC